MLEYSLDQAEDLLTKNFTQANLTMEQTDQDLDFLKYVYSILLLILVLCLDFYFNSNSFEIDF